MRLITHRTPEGPRLAVVAGDRALDARDIAPGAPDTIESLLLGGDTALAALRDAATPERIARDGRRIDDLQVMAPVPRPGKVIAIGRNYPDHAAEQGVATPPAPLIFAKWSSCVIATGEPITWDAGLTQQVDYEAELAVVVGRTARNVTEDDALSYVLGYTCLNDVSARDLQFGDGQWTRGKSLDTFCPMGPAIVTADDVPSPGDLAIACSVNGEVVQSARTSEMLFPIERLISHCSRAFTLEPGDVIATGTPAGVGVFRRPPRFLADGDVVTVSIERIGDLANPCRVSSPSDGAV
jgi:2-keto-4-pentenoate hydratase/2-oxohepta-3-ene-1,7-dioic acid hydratase in catechol pathway